MLKIKVFSPEADELYEGQHLRVSMGSVEGRKVVTLTPVKCSECHREITESTWVFCGECSR